MVRDQASGSDCTTGALVAKATAGDRAALEELLINHSTDLAHHITGNLPPAIQSQVSVDDILQQVFVDVFRGIKGFTSRSEGPFVSWLRRIADRHLQDALKQFVRENRAGPCHRPGGKANGQGSSVADLVDLLSASGDSPSGYAARCEAVQAVQVGIAGLPADQRDAVRLHLLQGISVGETAALMDRTTDAVRGLVYRAKRRLRAIMRQSSLWLSKKG
jgi:RNA polymerase sigma-70 factor (ECF subfamily)